MEKLSSKLQTLSYQMYCLLSKIKYLFDFFVQFLPWFKSRYVYGSVYQITLKEFLDFSLFFFLNFPFVKLFNVS